MTDRPRVLHICPEYPPAAGGIADYTGKLTEALAERGFDTRVLTSIRPTGLEGPGVSVAASVQHWDRRLWSAAAAEIRAFRPDVLHIEYQYVMYEGHPAIAWLPAIQRARLRRPYIVTTLHDMTPPPLGPRWAGRLAFEALLLTTDWLIVTTDANLRGAVRRPGLARRTSLVSVGSNITVHPIDDSGRKADRASILRHPGAALLVYFGLIRRGKGLEALIDAVTAMRRRSVEVELAIVGDIGDGERIERQAYREDLIRQTRELGLEGAVHMLGHLPEPRVSAVLQSCDLVVLPFEHGASPGHTTVLAALSHGAPLLTTRSSATPAAFEDAMALVDAPPDAPRLAEAIEQLMADPARTRALAARAVELASRHAQASIVEQVATIYLEGIRRKARGAEGPAQAPKTPTAISRLK